MTTIGVNGKGKRRWHMLEIYLSWRKAKREHREMRIWLNLLIKKILWQGKVLLSACLGELAVEFQTERHFYCFYCCYYHYCYYQYHFL